VGLLCLAELELTPIHKDKIYPDEEGWQMPLRTESRPREDPASLRFESSFLVRKTSQGFSLSHLSSVATAIKSCKGMSGGYFGVLQIMTTWCSSC
jgi:hypothetical protein